MNRSHDREALNESRDEPEPALGSGSSHDHLPRSSSADPAQAPLLTIRQRQHDAANWLAVLRGHLDLLAHDPEASASLRSEWLDRARSAAAAAERLLRGGGRPQSGSGIHSPLAVVLQDLSGHAHSILHGQTEVHLDLPFPERRCVLTDDDLEDVLLNLLRNAGQALQEHGGVITLRAREAGPGQVQIEVEDDGKGMSPEVRERCLEPGFSTSAGAGRGLGLARVQAIVHAAEGRIEIDSEFGHGTCIRLVLATFEDEALPVQAARVLLVDDDPDVREVFAALLDRLGVHTVTAADGGAARARMREFQFDLVVVDRQLPDIEGDSLAIEVRQADPTLAIVLLTGDPSPPSAGGAFDAVLVKPVGLERLRELLGELLPLARRRRTETGNA